MSKRLIKSITPQLYQLSYDFNLDTFTFELTESIKFSYLGTGSVLTFHGVGLKIQSAHLDGNTTPTAIDVDTDEQTVALHFEEQITQGSHLLELKINASIDEGLHGLYRSRYSQGDSEKWICVTQFEAVHAREAFICIDEPAAKAVFEISLTAPADQTVLANTDTIREVTLESGRVRHDFLATPMMSTYLVAFIVGELTSVKATTCNKTAIRVYATKGKETQLAFALDTAVRALEFYDDYFNITYPLTKLDMVAIPDFAAGAMENWGLVTYRETALLLDSAQTSLGNRQRVAEVITHELAHQWFGNLVTMAWWNDLWLNEGFASWMEILAQDHLFPEWTMWEQFTAEHYAHALELDGLVNSHPIEVVVEDPRELDEIFDAVSYSKGAAIINMLHTYLGKDVFRDGLRRYVKDYSYSNAVTADLWQALESASGRPVVSLMADWTLQAGYPVLSFEAESLHQKRFLNSGIVQEAEARPWTIPISLLNANSEVTWEPLMKERSTKLSRNDWVKLNPGQTGYYRIAYDRTMLQRVLPSLEKNELTLVDRFGVINDLFATTQAGLTSSVEALTLLSSLQLESSYLPSIALRGGFDDLLAIVESDELRSRLMKFGAWLNQPNLARLGWDPIVDEPYLDSLLRPITLQTAIRFGNMAAIAHAHELFDIIDEDLLPDIRPAVYYAAARYGDSKTFDGLLARYKTETIPQERMRLLGGLCRFQQPELIKKALELGVSNDVRSQDTIFVLAWSFFNREARALTWQFVKDNWDLFLERYGSGGHMLDAIPQYAGMAFANETMARELETFFKKNGHPSITRPVAQAVESIRIRAAWYARDKAGIETFLDHWESR